MRKNLDLAEIDELYEGLRACSNHGCILRSPSDEVSPGRIGTNAFCNCFRDNPQHAKILLSKLKQAGIAVARDIYAKP